PNLLSVLTPHFKPGCQRILLSDDYYKAIQRENVQVITDPIACLVPEGIVTRDGRQFDVDVLVYATGFRVGNTAMSVTGRNDIDLQNKWSQKGGPEAYLGISLPDFPNFFILLGPNTALSHNSVVFMIECQVQYALQCIKAVRKRNMKAMDLREEAFGRWRDE